MNVWHLELQQWIEYKKWMRWCPDIVTRYVPKEIRDANMD